MIYFVNYLGTSLEVTIDSDDRNIPTFVPSYWTQEMLNTIADLPRHEEPDPEPSAPQSRSIDMRRLRLALLQMNFLDSIDAVIAVQPRSAQIEWEFATNVQSDHPLVLQIATALSLNINQIFDLAETFT